MENMKRLVGEKRGFPWGTVREGNSDIFTYVPWEHKLPFLL